MPRSAPASLIVFLKSGAPKWTADLFDLTLQDGTAIHLTSSDQAIKHHWNTYSNLGPALQRSRMTMTNTAQVPELELKLFADNNSTIKGVPVNLFLHNGGLDGAQLLLSRAFMPSPGVTAHWAVPLFSGRASTMKVTGAGGTLTFKGDNVLWNQYFPRNCYQAGCIHALYDVGCTLSKAAFTISKTVHSGANTARLISWSVTAGQGVNYTQGSLIFTSGAAAGVTRTILFATDTALALATPLDVVPSPGDGFDISMGCDFTQPTCVTRFNNLVNFRGFPWVPDASLAF